MAEHILNPNDQSKPAEGGEQPKIIVDDDWKAQAQAEKERLAKEVESSPKAGAGPAAPGAGAEGAEGPRELPPPGLSTIVSVLLSQIQMAMGGYVDPETRRRYVDLDLAKHFIDTLSVLEEKTRGNVTPEEKDLLDSALYESRMHYVQLAQRAGM